MAEPVFFKMADGTEICNEEQALAVLLAEDVCFVSGQDYMAPWDHSEKTCGIIVNCNDLFYWGCADGERLPQDQIESLYRMWLADPKWGADKWCCFRRNLRPQVPIVKMMKDEGVWDAAMEALPTPQPS